MSPFLALLGIVVIIVLLVSVLRYLLDENTSESTGEWIVLVETEHSHEIHTLKAIIEQEDIPVIVETESPEVGGIPTNLTRNILRVPSGQEQRALSIIRNSEIDTNKFNVREKINPKK